MCNIERARNGREALDCLRGVGRPALPKPYIVLLDIHMPGMNGLEFLRELRADEELRDTVVIVLSTSSHSRDMREAYRNHAAGYVVKDPDSWGLQRFFKMLEAYLDVVRFPRN